jgi:hypothetical protein
MSWKEKSAAALVAAGLFGVGSEAQAQFDTNLVQNASFEDVTGGGVNRPLASGWTGDSLGTYGYEQGYTLDGPAGSGLRYWTGNANALAVTSQVVDLTSFGAGTLDSGTVNYSLSAFFSTYLTQGDNGTVRLRFRDAGDVQIGGDVTIGGEAFVAALGSGTSSTGLIGARAWGQDATTGGIPVGTRNVLVSLVGVRLAGTSNDSYIDLVDFQLTQAGGGAVAPEPGSLALVGMGILGLMGGLCATRRKAG